jgi:uncharacterized membrane protein
MEAARSSQVVVPQRFLASALAAGAGLWALAIGTAPLLAAKTGLGAALIYVVGSLICHQLPDRSFHVGDAQLPVCARCAGLYLGAAIGALAWAVTASRRRHSLPRVPTLVALAIAGAPTALTYTTALLGLFDPPNVWRAALAVPLGAAAGAIVGAVASGHLK